MNFQKYASQFILFNSPLMIDVKMNVFYLLVQLIKIQYDSILEQKKWIQYFYISVIIYKSTDLVKYIMQLAMLSSTVLYDFFV